MADYTMNVAYKSADKTLAAVDAAILADQEDWRRDHLGASQIGKSCAAALWWSFRWATKPEHSARLLRLFRRGHEEEDRFARLFRDAGMNLVQADPATGEQFRWKDGHFGGSMDGAITGLPESKQWHVWECKTIGLKGFNNLIKLGVEKAQPTHYVQMMIYMYWSGMERALYSSVCKDNDAIHLERVDLNKEVALKYIERAQDIIASDVPMERVSDDPSWYECKWCDHQETCHGSKPPQVSCRTCTHVTFNRDGSTTCERYQVELTGDQQRSACADHLFNPSMLSNWAEPVDANNDENWIEYRLDNGLTITNGSSHPSQVSSREIAAVPNPSFYGDETFNTLREQFDAKVCP